MELQIDLTDRLLNFYQKKDTMSSSDFTEMNNLMNKETKLKTVCDMTIVKERSDGRFYIYINRQQIVGATYPKLIDKLYEIYFGRETLTMENIFPNWMIWRRDTTKVKNKTLKDINVNIKMYIFDHLRMYIYSTHHPLGYVL
jgi:hypothetical protein